MARTAPPPLEAEHDWDQRLSFLIHDVSRIRRMVFDEYVRPLGLTRSQWSVMACLCRHDGMTQTDLAAELELGKSGLGTLLDRMEAAGVIVRRGDKLDRRCRRVYLAAEGKALNKTMSELSHLMSERILDGLGPAERQRLVTLLGAVKRNLVTIRQQPERTSTRALEGPTARRRIPEEASA